MINIILKLFAFKVASHSEFFYIGNNSHFICQMIALKF